MDISVTLTKKAYYEEVVLEVPITAGEKSFPPFLTIYHFILPPNNALVTPITIKQGITKPIVNILIITLKIDLEFLDNRRDIVQPPIKLAKIMILRREGDNTKSQFIVIPFGLIVNRTKSPNIVEKKTNILKI